MNKNTTWIIVVLVLIIGVLFVVFKKPAIAPPVETPPTSSTGNLPGEIPNPNPPAPASDMITVTNPKEGDTLDATTGFTVEGKAKGGWYFEASAPVFVYDKNGVMLAGSYVTAQGEWMTSNFVPFKGTIAPFVTNGQTEGYVQFENDNASGIEANRRIFRVNVKFAPQQTQKVKLYFGNTIKNPNAADCSKVYAVDRNVPKVSSIATLTLKTMLMGVPSEEATLGYTSAFGPGGAQLKSLNVVGGVATADFSALPSGGSCLMGEARAQIEQTLKQFSTIKSVKILLNGSESAALQP